MSNTDRLHELLINHELTLQEAHALELLENADGKIVRHEEFAMKIGRHIEPTFFAAEFSRPLIARLRRKIGAEKIKTIRGVGYYYAGELV